VGFKREGRGRRRTANGSGRIAAPPRHPFGAAARGVSAKAVFVGRVGVFGDAAKRKAKRRRGVGKEKKPHVKTLCRPPPRRAAAAAA